jgi:hypothetical protein
MAGQLSYSYQTPKGVAGSLLELSPYAVDSRLNGEVDETVMLFGMGAMRGDNPGVNVLVPEAGMTIDLFDGMILTGFTQQMDMAGRVRVFPNQTVGILKWGRGWARVEPDIDIEYGDALYLIIDGVNRGLFTNDDGGGDNLAIKGQFVGTHGTGDIAPIELYNQKSE